MKLEFRLAKKNGEYFIQYRERRTVINKPWYKCVPSNDEIYFIYSDWMTAKTVNLDSEEHLK